MKIKLVILTAFFVLMASCASMVPEKQTSADCLVVIKTSVSNPENITNARNYLFSITGVDNRLRVPKKENGYVYFVIKDENAKLESLFTMVAGKNVSGKTSSYGELNIPLPYSPGKMVIADFSFLQELYRVKSNEFMNQVNFVPLSEEEKQLLLDQLISMGSFDNWL